MKTSSHIAIAKSNQANVFGNSSDLSHLIHIPSPLTLPDHYHGTVIRFISNNSKHKTLDTPSAPAARAYPVIPRDSDACGTKRAESSMEKPHRKMGKVPSIVGKASGTCVRQAMGLECRANYRIAWTRRWTACSVPSVSMRI